MDITRAWVSDIIIILWFSVPPPSLNILLMLFHFSSLFLPLLFNCCLDAYNINTRNNHYRLRNPFLLNRNYFSKNFLSFCLKETRKKKLAILFLFFQPQEEVVDMQNKGWTHLSWNRLYLSEWSWNRLYLSEWS